MNRHEELISLYLDDSLTETEANELRMWLRADDDNIQKFVLATARNEQLRDAVVAAETLARAESLQRTSPRRVRRSARPLSVVKWVMVTSLVALVVWIGFSPPPSAFLLTLVEASGPVALRADGELLRHLEKGQTVSAGTLTVNGDGARAKFASENGTTISLSGASELTLPGGDGDVLNLRRGALVATTSRLAGVHPLIVRTSTAEATVLGTSFAISSSGDETLMQVRYGTVQFRRLSDNHAMTVSENEEIRVAADDFQPLYSEPIGTLPLYWRATSKNASGVSWLGVWNDAGVLAAAPRGVFLKQTETSEVHFHAGVINAFPGLVTLKANSSIRIRYRIERPLNLGIFISTHAPSWDFTGNFEAYIEHLKVPADEEGWRTTSVPMGSFFPLGQHMPFQPGCVVGALYSTSYSEDVGLEVAEFEVISLEDEDG